MADMQYNERRRGPDVPEVSLMNKEDVLMRELAILEISSKRSVLMPRCVSFCHAQAWYARASNSARINCGHMVRMKTERIGHDNIIDLSSPKAQKAFFRGSIDMWSEKERANHAYLRRAIINGEALTMLRARVNIDLMEIVDVDTGEVKMPYRDQLAQDYVQKVGALGWRSRTKAQNALRNFLHCTIGDDDKIHEWLQLRACSIKLSKVPPPPPPPVHLSAVTSKARPPPPPPVHPSVGTNKARPPPPPPSSVPPHQSV